jgi:glycerol-3-phosphate dehydrogenase (NAD+)
MRWSDHQAKAHEDAINSLDNIRKVVIFGGGSFGTAMAANLAAHKPDMDVVMLLRDDALCNSINLEHRNARYLSVSAGTQKTTT